MSKGSVSSSCCVLLWLHGGVLFQNDCPVVWVISKHPEHWLFTTGIACQALATALQHVLSALPCLDSNLWPQQQDGKASGQFESSR